MHSPAFVKFLALSLLCASTSSPAAEIISWGSFHILPSRPVSFAGGGSLAGAVLEDGSVSIWGDIRDSSTLPPQGLPPVRQLAIGSGLLGAVLQDGTLRFWGPNAADLPTPPGLGPARSLVITQGHVLVLLESGKVAEWGIPLTWSNVPPEYLHPPEGLSDVVEIAAGVVFSLALRSDGSVVAWGDSLGGPGTMPAFGQKVTSISAGNRHALATLEDGSIQAWGDSSTGYMLGSRIRIPSGLDSVVEAHARGDYSVAIDRQGKLFAWGENGYHQLELPTRQGTLHSIGLGDYQAYGFTSDDSIVNWGFQYRGMSAKTFAIPANLPPLEAVAASDGCVFALTDSGEILGWGYNYHGVLDIPSKAGPFAAISARFAQVLAITRDGKVVAWGDSSKGQTRVPSGLQDVAAISAGAFHSLALTRSGLLSTWGDTSNGLQNPPIQHAQAIAAGDGHSLAVDSLGHVRCWGDNSMHQCDVPTDLGSVTSLAAGYGYSMALQSDGLVRVWGTKAFASSMKGVFAISDGGAYGGLFALDSNGILEAHGNDYYGSMGQAKFLPPIRAMAAGNGFGVALVSQRNPPLRAQRSGSRTRIAPGSYDVRILTVDGRLIRSTHATWDGTRWSLPDSPHGVFLLSPELPDGHHPIWRLTSLR